MTRSPVLVASSGTSIFYFYTPEQAGTFCGLLEDDDVEDYLVEDGWILPRGSLVGRRVFVIAPGRPCRVVGGDRAGAQRAARHYTAQRGALHVRSGGASTTVRRNEAVYLPDSFIHPADLKVTIPPGIGHLIPSPHRQPHLYPPPPLTNPRRLRSPEEQLKWAQLGARRWLMRVGDDLTFKTDGLAFAVHARWATRVL